MVSCVVNSKSKFRENIVSNYKSQTNFQVHFFVILYHENLLKNSLSFYNMNSVKKPSQAKWMTVGTIGLLFFIFGFVTWLNGILIPYLKISCELNHFESYLVAFSFYVAYVIMAIPSSWLLKRTGLKMGMMLGLFVMAGGALFFIPAALTRTYALFLSGLFIMGTGLAILQTAANPYITMLGPIESAAQRISIMGICNKSAGVIATYLFGVMALERW